MWPEPNVYDARFSPDGTKIAFTVYVRGAACSAIHVADAKGKTIRIFEPMCGGTSVSWSADSRNVAFAKWDREEAPRTSPVIAGEVSTGVERKLTAPRRDFAQVEWSPRGQRLAYVTGPAFALHVARADGSRDIVVAHGSAPRWSPDGRLLAFFVADRGLAVIGADGSGFRIVDREATDPYEFGAAWSPRGRWLAYRRPSVGDDLWITRPDGTRGRRLTRGVQNEEIGPVYWSRDGQTILYTHLVMWGD